MDISYDSRIGEDIGTRFNYEQIYWDKRIYNMIKGHVKLFTTFTVAATTMFIGYMNFVTIYNVATKEFVKHMTFDHLVRYLFRTD